METKSTPTRGEVSRGLHAFITASGSWGAWGQAVGIGTAVFTGYALYLGADESFIALFTSIAYFLALSQLLLPLLSARIRNKKRFILMAGFGEILFRGLLIAIPFVFAPRFYLGALIALISLGLLCGNAVSPFYSTWIANIVPENIRARFTSRQTIVSTIVAMIAGFLIGQFIDLFPRMFPQQEKHQAFIYVFLVGTIFGWLGYLAINRAPFPHTAEPEEEPSPSPGALLQPFRDASFRWAVLFYGVWTYATSIAGPLYSVFMLKELHISYTVISIFNGVYMITSIGGYRLWAGLVDRFGSKPLLQILILPATLIPLIWVFNQPGNYYLVPVALLFSGILLSGIGISITPLLYGLLPEGRQRTFYLASWSVSVSLMGALGPLTGSFLVRYLQDVHLVIFGYAIGNLQLIFAISAACGLVPIGLLHFVRDTKGVSSLNLLSLMFRGNLLSYAYNAAVYNQATAEERRARAAFALGRSGNPLAIEQLIQALGDASPKVRSSAARALGETGAETATEPLIRELLDGESDIRSEAAEALGRLGHPRSIDPLIEALEDQDPRVRISAIRGLANIKLDEVHELLFWHFSSGFDPLTFPILVEVLGELQDRRIIKPTLERLPEFRSPAIRLQLLNSVCRALGAGDQFYRLLSYEDTKRTTEISHLLNRVASSLTRAPRLDISTRDQLQRPCQRLVQSYENDNTEWLFESVRQILGIVRDGLSGKEQLAYEILSIYMVILTINTFLQSPARAESPVAQEIFLTVCLSRLSVLVKELDF
jgi:MFS family permease